MATPYAYSPRGIRGKRISILSIDGGGVKGIIPTKILEFLEAQLQLLDGPEARIADYFDLVAGTSTGGLIAALLNVVDPATKRPRYTAAQATAFYLDNAKVIFPQKGCGCAGSLFSDFSLLLGPKYDGKALEKVLIETLGDTRLSQTFSNIIVPVFDVKLERPRFLSTLEAKKKQVWDPLLWQVCMATSAAPTYLPGVYFQTLDSSGNKEDFNCVDGAVANNNPTYVAIAHAVKEMELGHDFHQSQYEGYKDFLVLSLGTGQEQSSYTAKEVAKWGIFSWIYNKGQTPIINMMMAGSAGMVDFNTTVFFTAQQCSDNYIRVEANNLPASLAAVDDSSTDTLEQLEQVAEKLLSSDLTRWDLGDSRLLPHPEQGTNAQALARIARELSEERKAAVASSTGVL